MVTGGGRGIGRAIALAAAEAGARVVVADYGGAVDRNRAGSSEAADAVVAEIVAAGGEAVAAAVDISTMDGGRAAVQAAVDAFGRLDAVACAAGITVTKYLWEISEQEWDDVINVHLKGHFACAKAARRGNDPAALGQSHLLLEWRAQRHAQRHGLRDREGRDPRLHLEHRERTAALRHHHELHGAERRHPNVRQHLRQRRTS